VIDYPTRVGINFHISVRDRILGLHPFTDCVPTRRLAGIRRHWSTLAILQS
jgi:hypothetical protein